MSFCGYFCSLDNLGLKEYNASVITKRGACTVKINILHMIDGAKAARGIAVIIDVFRAFSTEAYLADAGARRIIPLGDIDASFEYKRAYPDTILCGEREGIMIEGFDYGNSPSAFEGKDLTGKTVVHNTSAGTQGIVNASGADEIIGGSLVCARPIAQYIKDKAPD